MYTAKILKSNGSGYMILSEPLSFYVETAAAKAGTVLADKPPKGGRVIVLRDDIPTIAKKILKAAIAADSREGSFCFNDLFYITDADAYNNIIAEVSTESSFSEFAARLRNRGGLKKLELISADVSQKALFPVLSPPELDIAARIVQKRINKRHMKNGVILADSKTAYIGPKVIIAKGASVMQNVILSGKTVIGAGSCIEPNSRLRDMHIGERVTISNSVCVSSKIADDTSVGPFAYIRPGCSIGSHVKIGDFVEIKNAVIGDYTKASHLTYIGDADLGERINMGCGTITANYDGKNKARTIIEDDVFIGSNSNLIAPVTVKKGAFVAAGSTITDEVPDGSLAIARARQVNKPEWQRK